MVCVGSLTYDPETGRLYKYGRAISLSLSPLRLLVFLMEHPERSFTVDELIAQVWGNQVLSDGRARAVVWSQVRRIRQVIEDGDGPWLVNERQCGYGLWMDPLVSRAEHLIASA